MSQLVQFFPNTCFDPEATRAMGEAYDKACRALHDMGQPAIVQKIIAERIIRVATDGERDPEKLCQRALKALGFGDYMRRQA